MAVDRGGEDPKKAAEYIKEKTQAPPNSKPEDGASNIPGKGKQRN